MGDGLNSRELRQSLILLNAVKDVRRNSKIEPTHIEFLRLRRLLLLFNAVSLVRIDVKPGVTNLGFEAQFLGSVDNDLVLSVEHIHDKFGTDKALFGRHRR